jgi:hypothetical protein
MKSGETGILVALIVFVAGGLFTALKAMPDTPGEVSGEQPRIELSVYDQLKQDIQPYHFGNVPRESFAGDTTVWMVDLDHNMYSIPQVDLYVTRILRRLDFSGITARERASGGIVFNAAFPNGQPLEIHFTSP